MTEQPLSESEMGRTCAECQRPRKIMAKSLCSTCYQRQWRAANPRTYSEAEKAASRSRTREWTKENWERKLANQRERYAADPEKARAYSRAYLARITPEKRRAIWVKSKYRLTDEQYEALLAHPGTCDACGAPFGEKGVRRNIDHCHTTGEFRGMLCHGCNVSAGFLRDDPVRADQLAAYLRRVTSSA